MWYMWCLGSERWTEMLRCAVRLQHRGRQHPWNVEERPEYARISTIRRRAADTAQCRICVGRPSSVLACQPQPMVTSTASSSETCRYAVRDSGVPTPMLLLFFFGCPYAHNPVGMLFCTLSTSISPKPCKYCYCLALLSSGQTILISANFSVWPPTWKGRQICSKC